jgi:hypothetical protein
LRIANGEALYIRGRLDRGHVPFRLEEPVDHLKGTPDGAATHQIVALDVHLKEIGALARGGIVRTHAALTVPVAKPAKARVSALLQHRSLRTRLGSRTGGPARPRPAH